MSRYLNEVNLIGFAGGDAEVSENNGPTRFSLATKRSWRDESQQWQSRTEWHNVVAWSGSATIAAQVKKGQHVRVRGELRSREFETEAGKQKIYEVVASEVHNLHPEPREAQDEPLA